MSFSHCFFIMRIKVIDMNIYESIYLVQMNNFYELKPLINYYRPMVTQIWADIFARNSNTIVCEKKEFYTYADLLLYNCIFEYRLDYVHSFTQFYRRCLKNKAYDVLRKNLRKRPPGISFNQKICEESTQYYSDLNLMSETGIHDLVMDKLMWENTRNRIVIIFGQLYVDVLELRMEGYSLDSIAKKLEIGRGAVNFILQKLKKWYAAIDS